MVDFKDRRKIWFSGRLNKGPINKEPSVKNGFFLTSQPEYAREFVGNDGCCVACQLSDKLKVFDFNNDADVKQLKYPKKVADMLFVGVFDGKDKFYTDKLMTASGFWAYMQSYIEGFSEELKSLDVKGSQLTKDFDTSKLSDIGQWTYNKFFDVFSDAKMKQSYDNDDCFISDGRRDVYTFQSVVLKDMKKHGYNCYYCQGDDGGMAFDELVIFSKEAFKSILPIELTPKVLDEVIDALLDMKVDVDAGNITTRDILLAITGSTDIDATGNDLQARLDKYHNKKNEGLTMKNTHSKKQISEAIQYWKSKLYKLNEDMNSIHESDASRKFHQLKSYTDLKDKETAECALMFKPQDNGSKPLYRWFPLDEVYDAFFKDGWYLRSEIDDKEKNGLTHDKLKKYIDNVYGE